MKQEEKTKDQDEGWTIAPELLELSHDALAARIYLMLVDGKTVTASVYGATVKVGAKVSTVPHEPHAESNPMVRSSQQSFSRVPCWPLTACSLPKPYRSLAS